MQLKYINYYFNQLKEVKPSSFLSECPVCPVDDTFIISNSYTNLRETADKDTKRIVLLRVFKANFNIWGIPRQWRIAIKFDCLEDSVQ